ncbi:unnamed protein product [Agarophyton chilense]
MFRMPRFHLSRSQRSLQSSSSRSSAFTSSTSASSLPVTVSRSTSLSVRKKASSRKYQNVILFLFALTLFSFAPNLRFSARTHTKYARLSEENSYITPELPLSTAVDQLEEIKVSQLSALSVHRISEVLFELVHSEELTSLAVYPCHKHLPILESLSQLLNLETSQEKPRLFCLDSSSAKLAEAHAAIRDKGFAYDVSFVRQDAMKKPPPKANIFVRIHNEGTTESTVLTNLLMSAKGSGAQVAVVNTAANKLTKWDVDGSYENAPFPLAEHIQLIKSLENGFVVVYDLFNMTLHE